MKGQVMSVLGENTFFIHFAKPSYSEGVLTSSANTLSRLASALAGCRCPSSFGLNCIVT